MMNELKTKITLTLRVTTLLLCSMLSELVDNEQLAPVVLFLCCWRCKGPPVDDDLAPFGKRLADDEDEMTDD